MHACHAHTVPVNNGNELQVICFLDCSLYLLSLVIFFKLFFFFSELDLYPLEFAYMTNILGFSFNNLVFYQYRKLTIFVEYNILYSIGKMTNELQL